MDNNWKLPDEIEIGLFYAPAPISEHWYGVIDAETKTEPLQRRKYTAAPTPDNNGWMPIESAPRDGTVVILLVEGIAIEGSFDGKGWNVASVSSHGCGCCGSNNDPPTGWLPLPPPPALDKGE